MRRWRCGFSSARERARETGSRGDAEERRKSFLGDLRLRDPIADSAFSGDHEHHLDEIHTWHEEAHVARKAAEDVAAWVSGTTSIGEAGKYLRELAHLGRFQTFEFPKRGFPPQLGEVIVTTNRPDPKKATTAPFLAGLLKHGTSILLVFGLGPRGLDHRDVYPLGRYHFDLTSRGLSLETATAIGAAPALIAAYLAD